MELGSSLDGIELPPLCNLGKRLSVQRFIGEFVDGDVFGAAAAANLMRDVGSGAVSL